MITVLTTTYNRVSELSRLYESLCKQSCLEFKWLVIDDGSDDDTLNYIKKISNDSKFEINYEFKKNGGKHSALNVGFDCIDTNWFLILDSDDWLKVDCIEYLTEQIAIYGLDYQSISFLRVDPELNVIGDFNPTNIDNYIDRVRLNISGDKAGVHKTEIARQYKFPVFKGENFMSEMPFFLWFGTNYKTKFINYPGYICEYQADGLSAKIVKNRYINIKSTLYVYECMYFTDSYLPFQIRAGINWWRFKISQPKIKSERFPNICLYPFGFFLNLRDRFKK